MFLFVQRPVPYPDSTTWGTAFNCLWQIETSPWHYLNWCIAAHRRSVRSEKRVAAPTYLKDLQDRVKKKKKNPLTHSYTTTAWPLDRTLNSSHLGLIINFTEREVSKRKWLNYRLKLAMERVGCLVCAY